LQERNEVEVSVRGPRSRQETKVMRIESIVLENYKALQNVRLSNLPPYAVFVGPNGSGKTTVFVSGVPARETGRGEA